MEEMEANFDCELITYQSRTHTRLQMGILGSNEYVECSASDLIGQYVGQTEPKTEGKLTEALGRVLFIDEAYRFCDGHFGTEAINELVECLTKPKFMEKIVVILAGYTHQIDDLLRVNPGRSRVGNTFRRMTRLATVRSYNVYSPPPKRSNIWYIYLANRGQANRGCYWYLADYCPNNWNRCAVFLVGILMHRGYLHSCRMSCCEVR
jgi:hypothetical protein